MKKFNIVILSLLISYTISFSQIPDIPQYYCTAIDSNYFNLFLNLLGSIHHTNFEQLEEIAVFDLGLNANQIAYLNKVQKLKVYSLQPTNPDMLKPFRIHPEMGKMVPGWYSWKYVAIKQALDMYPYVLWIDAGSTVLKSLNPLFNYIKENGYFLCTIGNREPGPEPFHPVGWGTTTFVANAFNLNSEKNKWILDAEFVMGGIMGAAKGKKNKFLNIMYECTKDIRYFQDDGTTPYGRGNAAHDQAVLSAVAYSLKLDVFLQDHRQINPITLKIDNSKYPLYITWSPSYLSEKTCIYSSRGDLRNKNFYLKCIKTR